MKLFAALLVAFLVGGTVGTAVSNAKHKKELAALAELSAAANKQAAVEGKELGCSELALLATLATGVPVQCGTSEDGQLGAASPILAQGQPINLDVVYEKYKNQVQGQ